MFIKKISPSRVVVPPRIAGYISQEKEGMEFTTGSDDPLVTCYHDVAVAVDTTICAMVNL